MTRYAQANGRKMDWTEALDELRTRKHWAWPGDDPGVMLARTTKHRGVIQLEDRSTYFGRWDGEKGTDGALLTVSNGDVYNECGGLVSKGRS